jgi:hypothetical protein
MSGEPLAPDEDDVDAVVEESHLALLAAQYRHEQEAALDRGQAAVASARANWDAVQALLRRGNQR